ncbi:hypothetical protein CRI94_00880 [Longibacter salinarum]|uniref:Protein-glutamine gamma-glutamyltransferase-like C-terminal domain-containing protein n=2 Tax=Longibacter salinarum TaxID=1850348 RepID=A0A2A8D1W4_9BACT|nr:hypothetical protein CRI94_00880 [Longibacter salinarum]
MCLTMHAVVTPAADAQTQSLTSGVDTTQVGTSGLEVRIPPDERLDAYRSDDTYDYVRESPDGEGGFLRRALSRFLDALFGTEWGVQLTEYVIYAAIFLLVAYGILALIRMEPSASRRRRPTSNYQRDELEERVQEADFDTLIEHALDDQDYRSALRLLYLRALQILDQNDWIQWAPERTNAHYERRLRRTMIGGAFREATHIFDVVWYGDVHVEEADFRALRRPFDTVTEHARENAPESNSHADMHSSSGTDSSRTGGDAA